MNHNTSMLDFKEKPSKENFEVLYKATKPYIYNLIKWKEKSLPNHIQIEDVLQEYYMNVFKYPSKFQIKHINSFKNWSIAIINNIVIKKINENTSRVNLCFVDSQTWDIEVEKRTPFSLLCTKTQIQQLQESYIFLLNIFGKSIKKITPARFQAMHFCYIKGMGYKQAAKKLNIQISTLKMRVYHGKKMLLKQVTQALKSKGNYSDEDT